MVLFAVGFIFMIHGTDDHLEDAVDCTAVEPYSQGSNHQPFNGCLLNTGQRLLIAQRNVLGAYGQNTEIQQKQYRGLGSFNYKAHFIYKVTQCALDKLKRD